MNNQRKMIIVVHGDDFTFFAGSGKICGLDQGFDAGLVSDQGPWDYGA